MLLFEGAPVDGRRFGIGKATLFFTGRVAEPILVFRKESDRSVRGSVAAVFNGRIMPFAYRRD